MSCEKDEYLFNILEEWTLLIIGKGNHSGLPSNPRQTGVVGHRAAM